MRFSNSLKSRLKRFPTAEDPTYDFAPDELLTDKKADPDRLRKLSKDPDTTLAFNALFTLLTMLWSQRKYHLYRETVFQYRDKFGGDPRYPALLAQAYRRSTDIKELQTGLDYAHQALKDNPDSPKALHTFAAIVTSLADREAASLELLNQAEEAVDRAMNLNPTYPWYPATLARLLTHQGRFEEAKGIITQELEEIQPDQEEYTLLLVTYQNLYQEALLTERLSQ